MKRLKIECNTPCMKVMNGTAGGKGKSMSVFLRLEKLWEQKQSKNDDGKKKFDFSLGIKSLKGFLNHKSMDYALNNNINACYSGSKKDFKPKKDENGKIIKDKDGKEIKRPVLNEKLLKHFHYRGDCEGKCFIYDIFGGVITKEGSSGDLTKPSKISVWANPIVSENAINNLSKEKRKKVMEKVKENHIQMINKSVENLNSLGINGESIQNFSEEYISGDFNFYIDLIDTTNEHIALLMDVLLTTETKIGRGKTRGNGKINIRKITMEDVSYKRMLHKDGTIKEKENVIDKTEELHNLYNAWLEKREENIKILREWK